MLNKQAAHIAVVFRVEFGIARQLKGAEGLRKFFGEAEVGFGNLFLDVLEADLVELGEQSVLLELFD